MSDEPRAFNPLDRGREIEIRERNLPHWFQPGAAIFITFRTEDSLPKEVVLRMQRELEEWLRVRSLPVELGFSILTQRRVDHDNLWQDLARLLHDAGEIGVGQEEEGVVGLGG